MKAVVPRSKESTPARDDEPPRYSQRDTVLTMAGVISVMLLASLDQTIVATAMPRVIAELQGFDRYTWVSTAYLLSSTVTVPIYGKLSDLIGRKPIFLFGVIVFLIGSALSGAAQTMNQLIAFRAFQGIGAGALAPIAFAIIGDLFTPRERGRWQGLTGGVWGFSALVGPAAGGWITQNVSWRWVFYVNLPIGILALLVLVFLMPMLRGTFKQVTIDYVGAALLVIGTVPLLLGFSWAGTQYAWVSPQISGLFAVAAVALSLFVWQEARLERRGGQPIIEPSLVRNSIFLVSTLVTLITAIGMFSSIFFIPLFIQGVIGASATNSGFILTPLMLTMVGGSIFSGQIISRTGKYKWLAVSGMVLSVAGSLLLLRLDTRSSASDVLLTLVVLGLGMGLGMAVYTLAVQNAMPQKIGQATSALVFFRSIGASFGLAIMGSVMSATYIPAFQAALPPFVRQLAPARFLSAFNNPQILLSPDTQARMRASTVALGPQGLALYAAVLEAVKTGLAQAIHNVFLLSLAAMLLGLVAVLFLKEIELRGGRRSTGSSRNDGGNTAILPEENMAATR